VDCVRNQHGDEFNNPRNSYSAADAELQLHHGGDNLTTSVVEIVCRFDAARCCTARSCVRQSAKSCPLAGSIG
jgi:hypothetical protein